MLKAVLLVICGWSDPFSGWETLSKLTLVSGYDEFLGEETEVAVFSEELKAFQGQQVTLEGYVIPISEAGESDYFVLSRFPYNSCFFCGNAGPETVAEIYTTGKHTFVDQKVKVTGTLKLNATDPFHLFFILEDSEVKVL